MKNNSPRKLVDRRDQIRALASQAAFRRGVADACRKRAFDTMLGKDQSRQVRYEEGRLAVVLGIIERPWRGKVPDAVVERLVAYFEGSGRKIT